MTRLFGSLRDAFVEPGWEKILTPRAKQVMALSRRAASEHGWKQVEVEHLLAGILRLNQGLAVTMLRNVDLEPNDRRASLEQPSAAVTSSMDALKIRLDQRSNLVCCWRGRKPRNSGTTTAEQSTSCENRQAILSLDIELEFSPRRHIRSALRAWLS